MNWVLYILVNPNSNIFLLWLSIFLPSFVAWLVLATWDPTDYPLSFMFIKLCFFVKRYCTCSSTQNNFITNYYLGGPLREKMELWGSNITNILVDVWKWKVQHNVIVILRQNSKFHSGNLEEESFCV